MWYAASHSRILPFAFMSPTCRSTCSQQLYRQTQGLTARSTAPLHSRYPWAQGTQRAFPPAPSWAGDTNSGWGMLSLQNRRAGRRGLRVRNGVCHWQNCKGLWTLGSAYVGYITNCCNQSHPQSLPWQRQCLIRVLFLWVLCPTTLLLEGQHSTAPV